MNIRIDKLFSLLRYQKVGIVDGLIVLYAAITGGVSYRLMDKPITDIAIWFSQTPTFALPGWSFWDYLKFSVFASSMLMLVFGLLVYDRGEAGRERKMGLLTLALASIIVVYLLYFLYYILGFFIADIPVRLLVLAITLTLVEKQTSTSSMARSFWTGLPAIYVTVCIVQALGFWPAAWCILAEAIIFIPSTILVSADD